MTEDTAGLERPTEGIPQVVPAAAVPYVRRQSRSETSAVPASGSQLDALRVRSPRIERLATTDYGYVVNELKRIAVTGACLIILLLIIARLLH